MTLTDRIAEAAGGGFIFSDGRWLHQWTKAQYDARTKELWPEQAADALENCEGCGGNGHVLLADLAANTSRYVPCPTCASLRACVDELLEANP